jgi:ATP-dependent protease ClpP protease subunit
MNKSIYTLSGEVKFGTFQALKKFVQNAKGNDVTIVIDSFGGNVSEGFKCYEYLISCGKNVTTIARTVYSIATVIYLAGQKRIADENSAFMVHLPSLDLTALADEEFTNVDRYDLQTIAKELLKIENRILSVYVERCQTNADFAGLMAEKRDTFFDCENAYEYGFCNEISQKVLEYQNKFKSHLPLINMSKPTPTNLASIFASFAAFFKNELEKEDGTPPIAPDAPPIESAGETVSREEFTALSAKVDALLAKLDAAPAGIETEIMNKVLPELQKGFAELQKTAEKLATNGASQLPQGDPQPRTIVTQETDWRKV